METVTLFLETFAGFFAVMDPIGAVPVLIVITASNTNAERRRMVRRAAITAFLVLAFFGLTQLWLFRFFGFTMGAFRVAGGLFLFVVAFDMLTAQLTGARQTKEEEREGVEKADVSITPLAVPLLAGPAMITGVILALAQARALGERLVIGAAVLAVCVASWAVLRASDHIHRWLGATGIKVVSRMMGLLLAAMAVQFLAEGLIELFPVLRGG
jgi:multiple antibiotic resistance protein